MTLAALPTEWELEQLHLEMRRIRAFVIPEKRGSMFCVYCGAPCYGRACRSHRDLVQIENRMAAG